VRRLAALGAVLAALAAAGGGGATVSRPVVLTDAAIAPARVAIHVGDSVRWANAGKGVHRVVSTSGAFGAFSLSPGHSKTVRFSRAGCFSYRVDGTRTGQVAVGSGCGGGGGGNGGGNGGGASRSGQAIYHYDVTVVGDAHTLQRHSGDTKPTKNTNGSVDVELAWTSVYRNVAVKKEAAGSTFVLLNATGRAVPGSTRVTFTYSHNRDSPWGPCHGHVSPAGLASLLLVSGSHTSAGFELRLGSQLALAAGNELFKTTDGDQKTQCNGYSDEPRWIEIGGSPVPDLVHDGLTWADVDPISGLGVSVTARRASDFAPLTQLERGAGFAINTGRLPVTRSAPCHFGVLAPTCTETFTGKLKVTFTPRR
jgi:plastocyanin